ncbi:MAG: 4-hydroxy-3-methylbut-2-enyl diphosphate reductase, partial [Chitinophagaceae bacterium]
MRHFDIPENYKSPLIQAIKRKREKEDFLKKDYSPTSIDFGIVKILLPRHFGLCFGVANAIEIVFKIVAENPNKKIYLLSEMIHNPIVNKELQDKGIQFLMDTQGNQLIPFSLLSPKDIVLIPAFGIPVEIEKILLDIGVTLYNTTCPFVERVWKRAKSVAEKNYTIIIHGKINHEETRSTYSHASQYAPCLIIKDLLQAEILKEYIQGKKDFQFFEQDFQGQYSSNFNYYTSLDRLAVINQTTMLATETKKIANMLKMAIINKYDLQNNTVKNHFADTRDTLCYATNDNQQSLINVFEENPNIAIVVGGYNSSNTS